MDGSVVALLLVAVVVAAVGGWAVATHNSFARQRRILTEAWGQIDVELRRRRDLVPPLAAMIAGDLPAAADLAGACERCAARAGAAAADPAEQARRENALTAALGRLLAAAETSPRLSGAEAFARLHGELTDVEDHIAAGRRFYNAHARHLNARLETFPAGLVARLSGIRPAIYFAAEDPAVRAAPAAAFEDRELRRGR
ncbi:LemA family protein [Georgenia thermotolerans]|uniref:LemA family protein n=1 Tax=Georgenia thermotolerans TaxID=527326 RepID=A0A7J5URW6_9MICO|nr:LemA family protein [Georgenia thermotolerans]KAE8765192.1 LemA family protein [Georgenia thermotolerans]